MGTSHRHKLGVVGQPNWGNVSSSITGLANGVAELDMLDNNPPVNMTPQQKSKRQRTLGTRISQKYHHAIRDLLRASGGRVKVSNGQSRAFGYAGIVIAEGIAGTFQEIVSNGLIPWLQRNGISSLEEMSCRDILDIIRKYIDNGVTGLDDTAAKEALEHIMDLLESRMDDDFSSSLEFTFLVFFLKALQRNLNKKRVRKPCLQPCLRLKSKLLMTLRLGKMVVL